MNLINSKPIIIACDHGYGNMKTAHAVFKTGVTVYDKEPTFKSNLLVYNGRYYLIGDEHKEFTAEKMNDQDYYILTLAAIGIELRYRGLTSARVYLAAGLPLTWVSEQKEAFKAYLLQNKEADFTFRGESYHVEFAGADVFPQGFSAVVDHLREFKGVNMLCDIGNGSMNIMYINNGRPIPSKCFTEKFGTHQCMLAAREKLMQKLGVAVDDTGFCNVITLLIHGLIFTACRSVPDNTESFKVIAFRLYNVAVVDVYHGFCRNAPSDKPQIFNLRFLRCPFCQVPG